MPCGGTCDACNCVPGSSSLVDVISHFLISLACLCTLAAACSVQERDDARSNLEAAAAAEPPAATANGKRAAEDGPEASAAKKVLAPTVDCVTRMHGHVLCILLRYYHMPTLVQSAQETPNHDVIQRCSPASG